MESCNRDFGCHNCTASLRGFIEVGEQALETNKIGHIVMALKELKEAVELARIIAFTSENKEG